MFVSFNHDAIHQNQYTFDKGGYYLYLPAVFIYHDLRDLSFFPKVDSLTKYSMGLAPSLHPVNGHRLIKYPPGVAIMQLPLFLVVHTLCLMGLDAVDGFSPPYQLAVILSTILWAARGLACLRRFLALRFSDAVVAITLACIAFGTNLYTYCAFDSGMSHPYSFALFAAILHASDSAFNQSKLTTVRAVLLGILFGMVFLVRPVNLVVGIIPLAFIAFNWQKLKSTAQVYRFLVFSAVAFACLVCVQLRYWHYISGQWFIYPYIGEYFNFSHPHILNGLFSYRKGWFLYTPLAVVCIIGCVYIWKDQKKLAVALLIYLAITFLVVFSWSQWWYGGAFSNRALIETLAILSLPLAAIINHFYRATILKKISFFSLITALVLLNLFQSYQYSMGIIHWDRMTKEAYWNVFGKLNVDRRKAQTLLRRE